MEKTPKSVCGCEVYQVCEKCDPETYARLIKEQQGMRNAAQLTPRKYNSKEFPNGMGYTRHGSPTFYSLLEEMADTHSSKSHDYASNENPCGNYHFAGQMATMFKHSSHDAGFVGRLAEKIYRLANLESSGKTPTNESIADTERDIAVITTLWMADRRDRRRAGKPMHYCFTCGKTTQQGAVLFVDVNQQIKCMSCAQTQEQSFVKRQTESESSRKITD